MKVDSREGQSAIFICQPSSISSLNDWGDQPNPIDGRSQSRGQLVYKSKKPSVECGIWECTPGKWALEIPGDELCHFISGECEYVSSSGERLQVQANTAVFFPAGWKGECTVKETIRNSYVFSEQPTRAGVAPVVFPNLINLEETVDWGSASTTHASESRTSGIVLFKGEQGESEAGMWECTPGVWECHVTRDEYCHFMRGDCTYVHESGEVIDIKPDTVAFFPKDWRGICTVHETVRKIYLIV